MSAEELKQKGNERCLAKDFPEAIRLYSEAIALQPTSVYYCNRAAVYLMTNKPDEALADSIQAVTLDRGNPKAYFRMGKSFYALGKYQRALEEGFNEVLEHGPDEKTRREADELMEKCRRALPKDESKGYTFSYANGKRKVWAETEEDKAKRHGIGI